MGRRTTVLIAGALAGLLALPAGMAQAQILGAPVWDVEVTAAPTPLKALKIADQQTTGRKSTERPAVVPPPSSVTQGTKNMPPQHRGQNDPQSGAQGDGSTGGSQMGGAQSGTQSAAEPNEPSLPPIAPPQASGRK